MTLGNRGRLPDRTHARIPNTWSSIGRPHPPFVAEPLHEPSKWRKQILWSCENSLIFSWIWPLMKFVWDFSSRESAWPQSPSDRQQEQQRAAAGRRHPRAAQGARADAGRDRRCRLGRSVGWLSQVERGLSIPSLGDLGPSPTCSACRSACSSAMTCRRDRARRRRARRQPAHAWHKRIRTGGGASVARSRR